MDKAVILASNSPRRREILSQVGLKFGIVPADVDETVGTGENPQAYAVRVATEKARVVAERNRAGVIIAADTIVVLDDVILGKPVDAGDAERMLSMLSGRKHQVITGLAILDAESGKMRTSTAVTSVWFRELAAAEIRRYVKTGEPLDKAGAYGIQERGALLVERIEGCYFNVVGLPVSLLAQMLREFDIILI
jgi:septum formation protein